MIPTQSNSIEYSNFKPYFHLTDHSKKKSNKSIIKQPTVVNILTINREMDNSSILNNELKFLNESTEYITPEIDIRNESELSYQDYKELSGKEIMMASESVLAKTWLTEEEDVWDNM